jgi:hypothetical protein
VTPKEILQRLKSLETWDAELGGCGDPECCGTYIEHVDGSDWVRAEDVTKIIKEIEEAEHEG